METSQSKFWELQGKIDWLKAKLKPMHQRFQHLYDKNIAVEVEMMKQGKTQDEIDDFVAKNEELNSLHRDITVLDSELQNLFFEQAKEIDRTELETCLKYNVDGD